jgi:hypothetical protein
MRVLLFLCGLGLVTAATKAGEPSSAFVEVDYAKVNRSIAREPKYNAEPRYALFILDPRGEFRVWAVLDKSKAELPYCDVLYFDKNGNGDLTEPGKRFVGRYDAKLPELCIRIGDLPVPGTKLVHTDLRFLTVERHGYKGFWFSMKWAGQEPVEGGHGNDTDQTNFATSAAKAPILRPTPLGPLSFKCWDSELVLPVGGETHLQLSLGSPGSGPDTFCTVGEHYLVPGKDVIVATLLATDRAGQEVRKQTVFKQHCCGILYHDSVRVPDNAAPGKAMLRLELKSTTGKVGTAADIPIVLH